MTIRGQQSCTSDASRIHNRPRASTSNPVTDPRVSQSCFDDPFLGKSFGEIAAFVTFDNEFISGQETSTKVGFHPLSFSFVDLIYTYIAVTCLTM